MLWGKRWRNRCLNSVAGLLLMVLWLQILQTVTPQGLITDFIQYVEAAQVTIDATLPNTGNPEIILGAATVFPTDQIGYRFYVDSGGACVYSKTTNGGTSWGTAVVVDSQTDCFGVSVWYDRWTPDDAGNYIHIMTVDSGNDDLWYNRLDVTDDSRLLATFPVSTVLNPAQSGTIAAAANNGSITKGTDGTIYMAMSDNTDSYIVECTSNCAVSTSWTETGINPQDLAPDFSLLMPLPGGSILLINRDISADIIRSKVWNNTTWSAAWTTIASTVLENGPYGAQMSAAVNPSTGAVLLAYVNNETLGTIGGNNDDIRTTTYSGSSWTANGDILTDSTLGVVDVNLGINSNTGAVYATYVARTTPGTATTGNVYWKTSSNGMTSWGIQQGPVNTTPENLFGLSLNLSSYHRIHVSWYMAAAFDLLGDTIADLTPTTEVLEIGLQETEVRASSTDAYIGGAFVIDENVTTRNVTSITFTEAGTVNGLTQLDNIELWYDLDTSAPYDCASESYNNGATKFGSTDTTGFSSADGTSTFTDTVGNSTTISMCVYPVMDVLKSAAQGNTVDIKINSPDTDVLVSGSVTVIPHHEVALEGSTVVKLDTDFRIQRGVSIITGDTLTINAGTDYDAPVSSTTAFIRITNTGLTGAGSDTGGGTSNADDTTVYITAPENITSSITFQRGVASVNNTRVSWEIVEYKGVAGGENEIRVRRHQALTYGGLNTTVTSGAVPGIVTDADVAVFITSQYNPSAVANVYHQGISTAAWNSVGDTVTLTRGVSGVAAIATYAVVEFIGSNWKVQRSEHVYSAVGTTQTEAITAVNSLSRTFLHVQKRFPTSTHANFGHEVWLSGIGQVSYLLDAAATTPGSHVSVAWVLENTQTSGTPLDVTRSNGSFNTLGTAPQTNNVSIGAIIEDLSVSSIFANNRSDTIGTTWPEPILGVRLISTTQYEIWRSDIAANINYRTEVVEWPTAERKLEQNYYRLYVDNNALKPTTAWPKGGGGTLGENMEMTAEDGALALGDQVRIRMTVEVLGAAMPASLDTFNLQFGLRASTCSAITNWRAIGNPGSTTALWRGVDNAPADGAPLSVTDPPTAGDLLLSVASVAGTYEEQNSTAANPYLAQPGDDVEYDWIVEHNGAVDKSSYCFRMIESDSTVFNAYDNYPVIRTVGYEPLTTNWRWYEDENNATPLTPRANENIAPSNVENANALKLRVVVQESSGAEGTNVKFALQYSEYANFSQQVRTLTATSTCTANSIWCYYNGAGNNNAVISSKLITDADSCLAGVGVGCGTHNENASTVGVTFDQIALANTEFEFTLVNAGARTNRVYYFRLYDLTNNVAVGTALTFSPISLVTEGAALSSSIAGIGSGTSIAGIITDFTTTPTAIAFASMAFNTNYEAAQQVSINTNATEGYQLLMYARQQLLNSYGDPVPPITTNNSSPAGWATACPGAQSGCFGYHTTDATLFGGSTRFAPTDSYAALDTTPREIMYSSIPSADVEHIIYKIRITPDQPAGDYQTEIVYLAVPVH